MVVPFEIDDELATYLVQGNGMHVATRSAALHPHVTRACGVKVLGRTRIALLLPKATGAQAKSDLDENGAVAVTFCSPPDFRTMQLKGRCLGLTEASADDVLLAQEQLQRFAKHLVAFGHTRQQARNVWLFDLWRAEVLIAAQVRRNTGTWRWRPAP